MTFIEINNDLIVNPERITAIRRRSDGYDNVIYISFDGLNKQHMYFDSEAEMNMEWQRLKSILSEIWRLNV